MTSRSAISPRYSISTLSSWPGASWVASDAGLRRGLQVGRDDLEGLGGDERQVDGVDGRLAAQDGEDLLRHVDGHALLRLRGRSAEVRRDDDLGVLKQRHCPAAAAPCSNTSMAAPATVPLSSACEQGVFGDEAAARDVDDAHAGLDQL